MDRNQYLLSFLLLLISYSCSGSRLLVPSGGYARILHLQETTLPSFSISAWVNITQFPEGVAPILSYLTPGAASQVAFFLRHDGLGALWGGPSGPTPPQIDQVARRPRMNWANTLIQIGNTAEGKGNSRQRRDAVDYSGGLGDIETIFSSRSGKADNHWVPINFVDVGEMGVDDLVAAPSIQHEGVGDHRSSRLDPSYNDWTNVPYELHMQESIHSHSSKHPPETTIITEPSGDDDFVFFNWNSPSKNAPSINSHSQPPGYSLRENSWAPLWEPKKNVSFSKSQTPSTPPPEAPSSAWASPILEALQKVRDAWVGAPPTPKPVKSKPLPTKYTNNIEKPVWPTFSGNPTQRTPLTPIRIIPSLSSNRPVQLPKRGATFKLPSRIATRQTIPYRTSYAPQTTPLTTPRKTTTTAYTTTTTTPTITTTTTTTTPETTTTPQSTSKRTRVSPININRRKIVPTMLRFTKDSNLYKTTPKPIKSAAPKKSLSPSRRQTRIPLWKLINKPKHKLTTPLPFATYSPKQIFPSSKSRMPIKSYAPSKNPYVQPSLPSSRVNVPPENPTKSKISRPTWPVRRPFVTPTTTTTQPPRTTKIYKREDLRKYFSNHKELKAKFAANNKHSSVNKEPVNITPVHIAEFKKTIEEPELVQEGTKAVVYAVPISDAREFFQMYKKYQVDTSKTEEFNLHEFYNKMRTGDKYTEEIIDNSIKPESNEAKQIPSIVQKVELQAFNYIPKTTTTTTQPPVTQPPSERPTTVKEVLLDYADLIAQGTSEEILPHVIEEYYGYETANEDLQQHGDRITDYFIPSYNQDNIVLAELYRPAIEYTEPLNSEPAFYQEPDKLYHEQLPPKYKNEKPEKQYDFTIEEIVQPVTEAPFIPPKSNNEKVEESIESVFPAVDILEPETYIPHQQAYAMSNDQEEVEILPEEQETINYNTAFLPQEIPNQPITQENYDQIRYEQKYPLQLQPTEIPNQPITQENYDQIRYEQKYPLQLQPTEIAEQTQDINDLNIDFEKLEYDFTENEWYHLTFTWNGYTKDLNLYINGQHVGTLPGVLNNMNQLPEGGLFLLGRTLLPDMSGFDKSSQFQGEMSDVNLWSKELSPLEIQQLFQCQPLEASKQGLDWSSSEMMFYNEATLIPAPKICGIVS